MHDFMVVSLSSTKIETEKFSSVQLPQRHQGQHETWDFVSNALQGLLHQPLDPYCSLQGLLPTDADGNLLSAKVCLLK